MSERHSLNGGPTCTLTIPEAYAERRNLEIAFRKGWAFGLYPQTTPESNPYGVAGLKAAWRVGFDDVRRQMAEATK